MNLLYIILFAIIIFNLCNGCSIIEGLHNKKRDILEEEDEDDYILKSSVVPPVCPRSTTCPREKKCEPCPPCARCPEPNFTCKKVPNYRVKNNNALPLPYLNTFSEFR